MWKKFIIFALLQVAVLTTPVENPQSTITTGITTVNTTKSPTLRKIGNKLTNTSTPVTTSSITTTITSTAKNEKVYQTSCENTKECKTFLECIGSKCVCNSSNYWNGSYCNSKKVYQTTCENTKECTTSFECIGSKCVCNPSNYWNGSYCNSKKVYQTTCENTKECKTSLECIESKCACNSSYYWNGSYCNSKKIYQTTCQNTKECTTSLECIESKCACNPSNYWNGSYCNSKKVYQTTCQNTKECKTSLECIESKCACNPSNYWNGSFCNSRPNAPKFKNEISDNSSVMFALTVFDEWVTGFEFTLIKNKDQSRMTFRRNITGGDYRIGNLTAGECYKIIVYSLFKDIKSESSEYTFFCTHPNTPQVSVLESNMTAISLLIKKGDGNLSSYHVYVNGKTFLNVTFESSRLIVVNGEPGSLYKIMVFAVFIKNKIYLRSLSSKTLNCSTVPSPPNDTEITDHTTHSISLNITHGPGNVEYFEILQNGEYYSNVTAQTGEYTHVVIDDLIPGTLYRNFAIIAVSNGLNSSELKVQEHGTAPSTPNVTITSETTDTINIIITRGAGVVQKYNILMDGKYYKTVNVADNRMKTNALIDRLQPGTAYIDFTVVAVSNDVNSTEMVIPPHATLPERPLGINQQTSGLHDIVLKVTASNKANQDVLLIFKNLKNINVSTAEITSNRTHNGFMYTVSKLQIGTCYNLVVYSTFNAFDVIYTNPVGVNTSTAVCTLPQKPNNVTQTKATLTSMTFDIGYINGLNMDGIGITVVIKDMENKNISSIICNRGSHKYTCKGNNFDVGNCYHVCAYSVLNDIHPNRDKVCIERACTLPQKPNNITQTKATLTSMTFDIGYNNSLNMDAIGITVVIKDMKNNNISSIICNRTTHQYTCQGNNFDGGNCYQACAYSVLNHIYLNRDKVCIYRACTLPKRPSASSQSEATDNSVSLTVQSQYDGLLVKIQGKDKILKNCGKTDANETYSCYIDKLNIGSCYEMMIYAVLNNRLSDSNYSITACTRPGKPLDIIQFSATIESIVVNIKPNKAGLTNTIRLKSETGGKYNHTCVNKSPLFTCTLTALSTGECYNISAWAVLNNYESLESTMNESRICTRPSRPVVKFDRSTTYASNMSVFIHVETGEKDCYVIFLNGSRTSDASYNKDSKVTITNLEPGKYYQIQALAKLNGYESNKSIVTDGYTDPDRPSIQCVNSTTSIITISITKGDGGFDGYEIYVDPQWKNTYKAGKKQVQIPGRVPGTSSKVYGYAIANNIKSFKSHDIDCLTHPSPPKILRVDSRTNTTIILYIESGNGVVDSFLVLVNGSFHSKVNVDSSKTSITVPVSSLEAGTIYELRVKAASNNLNSTSSDLVINATFPSTPKIKIVSHTSTTITIQITNPAGKVSFYRVIVNSNESLPYIQYQSSIQRYSIGHLKPGAYYNISAVAVSNGIKSFPSSKINVFTDNFSLKVVTVKRTTNSVTVEIRSFDRCIKSYEIFVDDNLFKDVLHISQTQNETIRNLVPGTLYHVKVVVKADTKNKDVVFDIATLPGQPRSISVLQGMNYSDIIIVPPSGTVDFFTFLSSSFCLSSNLMNSSYILEPIPNKKNSLRLRTEPGVCCILNVVAVSNNITSTPLNSTVKRPESVPSIVDHQYMHILENSVTIFWSIPQHPNGIVAGYTLTFWSNIKIASIRFTCIDCPGANDCSFLSHKQMKSAIFTGSTTFKDINSTIPFKWRQTKFIFTIDKLQQYSNYSYTLWTSTKQGNGPVFSSSFRTVKGHTHESSSSGPIIAGAVVGSIVGTVTILVVGIFVYRWYRRRVRGNTTKPDRRNQQYEDISPEADTNVYETLEITM